MKDMMLQLKIHRIVPLEMKSIHTEWSNLSKIQENLDQIEKKKIERSRSLNSTEYNRYMEVFGQENIMVGSGLCSSIFNALLCRILISTCPAWKSFLYIRFMKIFSNTIFKELYCLTISFRSSIYLKLIFVEDVR